MLFFVVNTYKRCYNIYSLRREGFIVNKVVVRNGNVDSALRTFKQKNVKDGLLKKVREREEGYMKPGVKRRKAKKEAIKNSRKRERSYN